MLCQLPGHPSGLETNTWIKGSKYKFMEIPESIFVWRKDGGLYFKQNGKACRHINSNYNVQIHILGILLQFQIIVSPKRKSSLVAFSDSSLFPFWGLNPLFFVVVLMQ